MNTYQLVGIDESLADADFGHVTLCVSADMHDLAKAASRALGVGGWSLDDLRVVVWRDGMKTETRPWA